MSATCPSSRAEGQYVPGMNELMSLDELPRVETVAVIINCSTKVVTTLALLSAFAHTDFPVLLIDCESIDGSRSHFEQLSRTIRKTFFWLSWPLHLHGRTLDHI